MKRILILLLVLSLGLNVSLLVRQLRGGGPPPAGRMGAGRTWPAVGDTQAWHDRIERRAGHMSDHLGLDAEQREIFRQHHREAARDMLQHRQRVEAGRREIRRLVLQDPVDPAAVRAAVVRLGHEQAVMDSLVAEKLLEEMALLEPEQRVKLLGMLHWDHDADHGRPGHGRRGGMRRHDWAGGSDGG